VDRGWRAPDEHRRTAGLAELRHAGVEVQDIEIRRADLEDVFLKVMAGHAPEGWEARVPSLPRDKAAA